MKTTEHQPDLPPTEWRTSSLNDLLRHGLIQLPGPWKLNNKVQILSTMGRLMIAALLCVMISQVIKISDLAIDVCRVLATCSN